MYSINILGKERPLAMKMLAAREYKKLTGFNLLSPTHGLMDIFGNGKDRELDPALIAALAYCMLRNGDPAFDFSPDQVAAAIDLSDLSIIHNLPRVYIEEMTGKPLDESNQDEKNPQAPEKSGA